LAFETRGLVTLGAVAAAVAVAVATSAVDIKTKLIIPMLGCANAGIFQIKFLLSLNL
jgi:hypothetical protein